MTPLQKKYTKQIEKIRSELEKELTFTQMNLVNTLIEFERCLESVSQEE